MSHIAIWRDTVRCVYARSSRYHSRGETRVAIVASSFCVVMLLFLKMPCDKHRKRS